MGDALSCILFRPPPNARAGDDVGGGGRILKSGGRKGCWPPPLPESLVTPGIRSVRRSQVDLDHPRYMHAITIDDGRGEPLHGFHMDYGRPVTLFFFHGNAEDLDSYVAQVGWQVFMFMIVVLKK